MGSLLTTKKFTPFLYLLPALTILTVFQFYPILYAFRLSFFDWDMIGPKTFVGLKNYANLLMEPDFWKSIGVTFYYVLLSLPVSLTLSLFIAVQLNKRLFGTGFFRTAFFLPYVTSIAAISLVWLWIYNSNDYGLLNYVLKSLGLSTIKWLEDPFWAMPSIILMLVWHNLGFNVIIFLTRLQSIDPSYYEAADIDGANNIQKFKYITWPLLKPTVLFLVTISTIYAFKIFPSVYVMTPNGGPNGNTTTIVFYLFKNAYEQFRMGYASAIAYVLLFIILIVTLIQRRLFRTDTSIEY
jgi:multiple sugar transport system permease protein